MSYPARAEGLVNSIFWKIVWKKDIQAEKFRKKIHRTTMDYNIRRHQETWQNKIKSWAGWPRAENNFIRVTSLHDWRLSAPNITVQLNQSCGKMCQHPLWGKDSVKPAYITELLSRDHCWGSKKTMSKGSSGLRCSKTGQ